MAYCHQEERSPEFEPEIALQVDVEGGKEDAWYLDSGCSRHMTNAANDFSFLKPITPIPVVLADKSVIYAIAEGTVKTEISDIKGNNIIIVFEKVLHVPRLQKRLISISQLTNRGAEIIFKKQICILSRNGKRFIFGSRIGKLYELNLRSRFCGKVYSASVDDHMQWESCRPRNIESSESKWEPSLNHRNMNSSGSAGNTRRCSDMI